MYLLSIYSYVHGSIDTTDQLSVWRGPLNWRQLIWWKEDTIVAVGWDAMTQSDIICELEILKENDNSRIVMRFVLPCQFLFCCFSRYWLHVIQCNWIPVCGPYTFSITGTTSDAIVACLQDPQLVTLRIIQVPRTCTLISFVLRHKTTTEEPILRLCVSSYSGCMFAELMNGTLLRYNSGNAE